MGLTGRGGSIPLSRKQALIVIERQGMTLVKRPARKILPVLQESLNTPT